MRTVVGRFFPWGTLIVLVSATAGCADRPGAGENQPVAWELRSVHNGEVTNLSDLRGKAVFLNVWATWCPPCVAEMPSIVRLADRLKSNPNVAFVLVSMDDDLGELQTFLEKEKIELPVYTRLEGAPEALHSDGIPITFILGTDGTIQQQRIGSQEWDRQSVVDLLENLAKDQGS